MSHQRVTGMRIPPQPPAKRTVWGRRFHRAMCVGFTASIVGFTAAGEPWIAVLFVVMAFAYLAAEVHS